MLTWAVVFWGLSLLTLVVGLLALVKGGPAERTGAALILAIVIIGRIIGLFLPDQSMPILRLVEDGVTALGLLVIALRYASFWLGGAMLIYAALFTLHAAYFVLSKKPDAFFASLNNSAFLGVSICLGVGTIVSWRQRARRQTSQD